MKPTKTDRHEKITANANRLLLRALETRPPEKYLPILNKLGDGTLEEDNDCSLCQAFSKLLDSQQVDAANALVTKINFESLTNSQHFDILSFITNNRAPVEIIEKSLERGLKICPRDNGDTAYSLFLTQSGHLRDPQQTKADDLKIIQVLKKHLPDRQVLSPNSAVSNSYLSSIWEHVASYFRN